ncbi:hypothetical protein XENOCAPTIV_006611 [Xenoophorus captivus]|uniref:Secreted protein n=1 Tax=Xenoophorus captivus TaxID=1517983 RepID=A0ABV0QYW1_9TELE
MLYRHLMLVFWFWWYTAEEDCFGAGWCLGAAPGWTLEGPHPRQPEGDGQSGLLPSVHRGGDQQEERSVRHQLMVLSFRYWCFSLQADQL